MIVAIVNRRFTPSSYRVAPAGRTGAFTTCRRYHNRVLHRLFTFVSALSLLLCVATCALWMRSYSAKPAVTFWTSKGLSEVVCERGRAWIDNDPQREHERELPGRVQDKALQVYEETREMSKAYDKAYEKAKKSGSKSKDGLAKIGKDAEFTLVRAFRLQDLSRQLARQPMTPAFSISASLWTVAMASGVLPATWVIRLSLSRLMRKKRLKGNLCPSCGYDLRATPDRCPECGTAPTHLRPLI
jgi:hypothetical protein